MESTPATNPFARAIKALILDPWDRIDARDKGQPMVGRLTPRSAALWTMLTAALMLTALRFIVRESSFQKATADAVLSAARAIDVGLFVGLKPYAVLIEKLSWVFGCALFYFVIPAAVVRWAFGLKLSDFYMVPRDYRRHLPLYGLLFLPIGLLVLFASTQPSFLSKYPFYKGHLGLADLLVWELGYALQFFSLEFFFRGFMVRGLSAEMGASSVLAMVVPYCMIHFGKPLPECIGSILAGLVLGLLAMDSRSIWGGVTVHVAVAWSMDAAAIWRTAHH